MAGIWQARPIDSAQNEFKEIQPYQPFSRSAMEHRGIRTKSALPTRHRPCVLHRVRDHPFHGHRGYTTATAPVDGVQSTARVVCLPTTPGPQAVQSKGHRERNLHHLTCRLANERCRLHINGFSGECRKGRRSSRNRHCETRTHHGNNCNPHHGYGCSDPFRSWCSAAVARRNAPPKQTAERVRHHGPSLGNCSTTDRRDIS